jgi:hypothetical protein
VHFALWKTIKHCPQLLGAAAAGMDEWCAICYLAPSCILQLLFDRTANTGVPSPAECHESSPACCPGSRHLVTVLHARAAIWRRGGCRLTQCQLEWSWILVFRMPLILAVCASSITLLIIGRCDCKSKIKPRGPTMLHNVSVIAAACSHDLRSNTLAQTTSAFFYCPINREISERYVSVSSDCRHCSPETSLESVSLQRST